MVEPNGDLPKEKETVPGLYVTAKDAYEEWKAEPEIMCRTGVLAA